MPAHGERPPDVSRLQIAKSVLATLKTEHMPPTYGFINGVSTAEDPSTLAVLEAWRAAGQPLGNHTWSHPDLGSSSVADFEADTLKNEPLLRKLMSGPGGEQDWHWFRYPFLNEGDTAEKHRAIRAFLAKHQYQIAEVTLDFEDYLWNAPYTRCVAKHDDAAISKLHDSYLATAASYLETYRTLAQPLYGRDLKYVLLMHIGVFDAKMLPELLAMYRVHGFSL